MQFASLRHKREILPLPHSKGEVIFHQFNNSLAVNFSSDDDFQSADGTVKGATVYFKNTEEALKWISKTNLKSQSRENLSEAARVLGADMSLNIVQKYTSLHAIFTARGLSKEYINASIKTGLRGVDAFEEKRKISDLIKQWNDMSDKEREEVLQAFHSAISKAYNVPSIKMNVETIEGDFHRIPLGTYDSKNNILTVNINLAANDNDVRNIFDTVFHETIHRVQDFLILETSDKRENNKYRGDRSLIWINSKVRIPYMPRIYYLPSWKAYVSNPREEEAFKVSNAFRKKIGLDPIPLE